MLTNSKNTCIIIGRIVPINIKNTGERLMSEDRNTTQGKRKLLFLLMLLITLVAVAVSVWTVFFRSSQVIVPDYAPLETQENAESVPDDNNNKKPNENGSGSVNLTYSDQVHVVLGEKKAYLYFVNPGKSNQNMVVRILIKDELVAQSGLIVAGYKVNELKLTDSVVRRLSVGGYDGRFEIYFYNQDTNEKAAVNTEIPVRIEVSE